MTGRDRTTSVLHAYAADLAALWAASGRPFDPWEFLDAVERDTGVDLGGSLDAPPVRALLRIARKSYREAKE